MKNLLMTVSIVSLAVGMASCGKVEDAARQAESAVANADLNHTWVQEKCAPSVLFAWVGGTYRSTYNFSGANFTRTDQYYSASDCTNPAAAVVYSGAYKVGSTVQTNVSQIDLAYGTVSVTPQSAAGLTFLNTIGFCGKSDWAANAAVDLTAQAGTGLCKLDKMPQTDFDIYTLQNNRLYLGTAGDHTALPNRPTQIDMQNGYLHN